MIVTEAQADALVERILCHVAKIKVGDGLEPGTTMGPLVSQNQLRTVDGYVRQGVDSGCQLLTGGGALTEAPERDGFYYAPTVFDRVRPDSPLAVEEIFGPVLPILHVQDLNEAIDDRQQHALRSGGIAVYVTAWPRAGIHPPGAGGHDSRQSRNREPGSCSIRRRKGLGTRRVFDRSERQRVLHQCQSGLRQVVGPSRK